MNVLLIPSAILVSQDMRRKFGELPTALFPLGGQTMIEHICRKYHNVVDEIYIVVHKKKILIKDYVNTKRLPVEIVELEALGDLGHTVSVGMETILAHHPDVAHVYVNFADSLLGDDLPSVKRDEVYFSKDKSEEAWTYFNEKQGSITEILDKDAAIAHAERVAGFQNIFVGVFGFHHPVHFAAELRKIQTASQDMDSFYAALQSYSRTYPFIMCAAREWFDVGHSENYWKARTRVASRVFNTIEIDEKRGILKKRSENKEKLVHEIRWYLRIPNQLQYLLPRIYDYSLDLNNPYVIMEYYGYHTLHESLLYGDLPLVKWQDIFEKILFAITDMEKFRVDGIRAEFEEAMRDIYLKKTFARLNKLRTNVHFQEFFQEPITINRQQYHSLNAYIAMLPDLVEHLVLQSFSGQFQIIHGDLCFANILMEDAYRFIRLIDPRGRFGRYDIYGDVRYELAKLLHTIEGNYDFIIEDWFDIAVDGVRIEYHARKRTEEIQKIFEDVFYEKLADIQAIRLIEATLFLSMIPLHSDYVKRQYAMMATGIMLLERVIRETGIEGRKHDGSAVPDYTGY